MNGERERTAVLNSCMGFSVNGKQERAVIGKSRRDFP